MNPSLFCGPFTSSGSTLERAEETPFYKWAMENKHWVDLYTNLGARQSVMDAILVGCNNNILNWKTVMKKFFEESKLSQEIEVFPVCPGHSALVGDQFVDNRRQVPTCSVCLSESPSSDRGHFYSIKIKARIERMMKNRGMCEKLFEYLDDVNLEDSRLWNAFYSGSSFKRIVQENGGIQAIRNDLFIAISTDGCSPYERSKQQVWPILGMILNLPPHMRYLSDNIVPLGYFSGPHPSKLSSYFDPIITEIQSQFNEDSKFVKFYDGSWRRVRIHVVWILGDLPVVANLCGLVGHNGKHPCRFCHLEGVFVPRNKHYYYPSKYLGQDGIMKQVYDITKLDLRTSESIENDCIRLSSFVGSGTQLQNIQTGTGIKFKSSMF